MSRFSDVQLHIVVRCFASPRNDGWDCFVAIPLRNDDARHHRKQKGGRKARRFLLKHFHPHWVPGRSEAPPGLEGYFFFDFLAFFAFFAFFAFLAIASSFGLMDGNATRGMLGGGPASQHPQA